MWRTRVSVFADVNPDTNPNLRERLPFLLSLARTPTHRHSNSPGSNNRKSIAPAVVNVRVGAALEQLGPETANVALARERIRRR